MGRTEFLMMPQHSPGNEELAAVHKGQEAWPANDMYAEEPQVNKT